MNKTTNLRVSKFDLYYLAYLVDNDKKGKKAFADLYKKIGEKIEEVEA